MRIKICGITRTEDAVEAVRLGAWALGFIFEAESKRFIEPHRVQSILRNVPPSTIAVGVFMNHSKEFIDEAIAASGITMIQLHGTEDPSLSRHLPIPWIKRVTASTGPTDHPNAFGYLIDSSSPTGLGGTGTLADWDLATSLATKTRIILAGGISDRNVANAINTVHPWAIDVASGVESQPGVKDLTKMKNLFDAARAAGSPS